VQQLIWRKLSFRRFGNSRNVAVSRDGFMDKIKPDGHSGCLE
jgi:hypothetical protein